MYLAVTSPLIAWGFESIDSDSHNGVEPDRPAQMHSKLSYDSYIILQKLKPVSAKNESIVKSIFQQKMPLTLQYSTVAINS